MKANKIIETNLKYYKQYIENASKEKTQIIVFPEYGIFSPIWPNKSSIFPLLEIVPDASQNVNPVLDFDELEKEQSPILYTISKLARENNIYVVVDMGDLQYCDKLDDINCPPDGFYSFNTQVVFSNTGLILQKYHKINLYYENEYDYPKDKTPKHFNTSFGVTFGLGICFDIIFKNPMQTLQKYGITDFVYSTWWVNTPPFLQATTMQLGWSYVMGVNILASGSGANWFNSGSGIYSGGNVLDIHYNHGYEKMNQMMIADVPILNKLGTKNIIKEIKFLPEIQQNNVVRIETKILNYEENFVSLDIGTVNCRLDYSTNYRGNSTYALVVVDGYYWPSFQCKYCGLFKCSKKNCTEVAKYPVYGDVAFDNIVLTGEFSKQQGELTTFPIISEGYGLSFKQGWDYTIVNDSISSTQYQIEASGLDKTIHNFALFGRY
eukprot:TRINITY_DN2047_c0_g1_i2.p1 TRINITY_DN2047_c0_g1~~TRINITY_DN2047_c0_g1_i2.p1  ORF type:complete len:436 (-),score=74.37 TRINITY_DN2047_c0_g1_i2:156-1463(-)